MLNKIVIVGGNSQADYMIKMFKKEKTNKVIVIIKDRKDAAYISTINKINVFEGDPSKFYVLNEADVKDADVFIALSTNEFDNFVACSLAKKAFKVKKTVCTVQNPQNVKVFKELGIDNAISSTYQIAQAIKSESSLDDITKTLAVHDEKIVITEINVKEDFDIVGKQIMDAELPKDINISAIYREPSVIVPHGQTIIEAKDKLIIVSAPEHQIYIKQFIQKVTKNGRSSKK